MRSLPLTLMVGIALTAGAIVWLSVYREKKEIEKVTVRMDNNSQTVPLPQETDIVRTFFELIDENRSAEAVMMMGPSITNDENVKQSWGSQFEMVDEIEIKSVEAYGREDWTETNHVYQIVAEVKMKPEAMNAPIPNYSWGEGEVTKWIILEKSEGKWLVAGIASGP